MTDALASALASDAPAVESPLAAPAAPSAPAPEPSRRDTIREAVEAQKERAAASATGDNPNAPAKTPPNALATPGERGRAPDGKFAPATDRPAPDRTAAPANPNAPISDAPALGADAPDTPRPPPGWSPASKVAFDALPDTVKADIAKREKEVNQGFAKLAELKPVEKYAEMAKRGGTTLDRALENYVGIETLLRRDVFAGFEQIAKNTGINLRSFATAYLQRAGGGDQNPGTQPIPAARQQAAIDPQTIIAQAKAAFHAEHEAKQVQSEVQRFEADPKNRFYANVKTKMVQLVNAGLATTIQDAYDQACQLDPEIRRIVNAPPAPDPRKIAADQARSAARATVGAPSSGIATPRGNGLPDGASRKDVIRAAVAAQRGGRA